MKKVLLAMLVCVMGICCFSIGVSAEDLEVSDGYEFMDNAEYDTVTVSNGELIVYEGVTVTIDTLVVESDYCSVITYTGASVIINTIIVEGELISLGGEGIIAVNTLVVKSDGCFMLTDNTLTIEAVIVDGGSCMCENVTTIGDVYLINEGNGTFIAYAGDIHTMVSQESKEATCTEDGNIAYYSCGEDDCDAVIYIDDDGNYVITTADDEELILEATEHSENTNGYTNNGYGIHYIICSVCGEKIDDTEGSCEDCELNYDDNGDDETHTVSCSVCEYIIDGAEAHTYTWELKASDSSNKVIKGTCDDCSATKELTVEITLESDEYTYTGEEIEPTIVSVTINGENVTYTATYMNNINITEDGTTATIVITLTDYGDVNVEAYFTIVEEEEEEEDEEEEEEEEDEEEEDSTDEEEDTDSEEDTEDTTDDSNTDETETSEDTTDNTTDSTTNTDSTDTSTDDTTNTDTSDSTTSTYTSAYIQYIGGILMSGNTSTSTVEDVSTGAGTTAGETAGGSALAVVSLLGVAVVISRKRK